MDCSPPGSSVHEISQARILEWIAISYSKGFFEPRDQTPVPCFAGRFFTESPGQPNLSLLNINILICKLEIIVSASLSGSDLMS